MTPPGNGNAHKKPNDDHGDEDDEDDHENNSDNDTHTVNDVDEKRPNDQQDSEAFDAVIVSIKNEFMDVDYDKNSKSENKGTSVESSVDGSVKQKVFQAESVDDEAKSVVVVAKRKKRQIQSREFFFLAIFSQ